MKENEEHLSGKEQKSRIRERYKGIDADQLDFIPAIPQPGFYDDTRNKRVAVYARVSTDDPRQTSSYELQKNHYQDFVRNHPGWQLEQIYADEGISGTSLQHRDAFVRMIEDCYSGKIDLIVTKSVSRFARNVVDCIGYVRKLRKLQPPIGIFFESENIFTLDSNSEMSLSFISTLAQEESHNKSEIMNVSIEMRFRRGVFLTPPLIGYDQDEDGNLVINEEEAKTVRLIFFMYLYGYSTQQIADTLTELERKTKRGNITWTSGTVLGVLQNERHCGDVLARKTWTPDYLNHKSKKNRQNRNQYRQRDHHEAIISRDDFIAVQHMIRNARYKNKDMMPELSVISSGRMKGFVIVHPKWAGFKSEDYEKASQSIYEEEDAQQELSQNGPQNGGFDLRGYEIARGEFFTDTSRPVVTFSAKAIRFNIECISIIQSEYAELLVHPEKKMFAVRKCAKDDRCAVHFSTTRNGKRISRSIQGAAYIPTLFSLFHWTVDNQYRLYGEKSTSGENEIVCFQLAEAEVLFPGNSIIASSKPVHTDGTDPDIIPMSRGNKIVGYPKEWASSFGNEFYQHSSNCSKNPAVSSDSDIPPDETAFHPDSSLNPTDAKTIHESIQTMIQDMTKEANNEK